jgi:drug/metabolite transporter, DME family
MRVLITMPAAARRRPASGLLCLAASGLLWGTGGLTGSLLSRAAGLSAISVAAGRLTVGGVLIVAFLTVTGRRWPAGRAAWTRIALVGLLAALYQGLYFTAVSLTSVPLATLVTIGTAPVIVLAAERATGHRASGLALGAAGLALIGLGLLVGLPSGFGERAVLASAGMAVLAAAGFAAITLTGSRPVPGLDDLTVTGFGFTLGGLVLLPVAACTGLSFRPSLDAVGLLIALGTGPTAVAYTLYFRGLRTAAASTAALLALLEPLTGSILATFILGERLSTTGIAGAVILAVAVILTVRADHEHPGRAHGSRASTGHRDPVACGAGEGNRVDHVSGNEGSDAEPGASGQRLAQDQQADNGRHSRIDTHEGPEVPGRHPAQRGQVPDERDGRGQDARGARVRQRDERGRVPDQGHDAHRHEHQRRQASSRRRALRARQPASDQPVEQDIAGPACGGQ